MIKQDKPAISIGESEKKINHNPQNPCTLSYQIMYRHNQKQLEFEDFSLPFGGKLRSANRWVKLAKFIPWDEFEPAYAKVASKSQLGPPAKSVRVALGALIIKEHLGKIAVYPPITIFICLCQSISRNFTPYPCMVKLLSHCAKTALDIS